MSYEPTNWKTGDVITADKLNKLENGVAQGGSGGVFKINVDDASNSAATLDASYNDIVAAVEAGKIVLFAVEDMEHVYTIMYLVGYSVNSFIVFFRNEASNSIMQFSAETADESLTYQQGS